MTLDEFIAAYEKDSNLWWRTGSGEHLNHFDELVHQRESLRAIVARVEDVEKMRLLLKRTIEFWPDDAGKAAYAISDYLLGKEG